jgi:hypothetical protein
MSKMDSHDPLGYLKHKYGQKKGQESVKLPIWLPTTKNQKSPWFLYVQVACHIPLESSPQGLQLWFRIILIKGVHTILWVSKVAKVPILRISGLPLGVPRQNDIWVPVLWPGLKYTMKGKVVASPKSRPWWVLWVHVCSWFICAPKMF